MTKYLAGIIIIILIGCASVSTQKKLLLLDKSADRYGDAIRWGYFDIAERFRKLPEGNASSTDFSKFKSIKITSYEVLDRTLSENNVQATQTVEITYYYQDQMIQKTVIDRQLWKYDAKLEKWYIHSRLPDFGLDG